MKRSKKWDTGFRCLERLAMRFSDGGGAGGNDGGGDPAAVPAGQTATQPAAATGTAGVQPPAATGAASGAQPPAKTYTESDLQDAAQRAVEAYKQHLQEAGDYDKMTPEEKVAHLERQMAEEKLSRYTTDKLADAQLPPELAAYVKGKDEAETDERLKAFKAAFDKGVQAGVDTRFKTNGYIPKGSGAAAPEGGKSEKRPRGVTMN